MPFDTTIGMYDFGFLPPNFGGDVQVFSTSNAGQGTQKWVKRRGMSMVYMVCIGGGGGGGGGRTGATTTARGGGAGGAGSSIAKLLIPAIFLPDVLVVQIGAGGVGGAANTNGGAGVNSFISYGIGVSAISSIPNIILQSNNAAPGGGGAGTAGAGGTGGTVPSISSAVISGAAVSHGIPFYIVGIVGANGGAQTGAAGADIANGWTTICTTPGAGGAGVNTVASGFAGGRINLIGSLDHADGTITPQTGIIAGGVAGSAAAAGNGSAGLQYWKPFYMTGGSGGGSSDGSTGGNGGNGGVGCGGGGAGGGTTGGTGGNGGDGFVAIISW